MSQSSAVAQTQSKQEPRIGNACGVYCVYAAALYFERDADLRSLLERDYVTAHEGSTLLDLQRAADDLGLVAKPLQGLSVASLRRASQPLILHIKSDFRSSAYNHYVLLLGTAGDGRLFRVFDPGQELQYLTPAEVAMQWRGTALMVSDEPIGVSPPVRATWLEALGIAALLLIGVVGTRTIAGKLHFRDFRWKRAGLAEMGWSAVVLVSTATVIAVIAHTASVQGYLRSSRAVAAVQETRWSSFLPKVTATLVNQNFAKANSPVVIDARREGDYAAGHIPGAISIPVGSTAEAARQRLAGVAKDQHIVIYCQSRSCDYDERVARTLLQEGYTNLSIFHDGWVEWKRAYPDRIEVEDAKDADSTGTSENGEVVATAASDGQ